MLTLKNVHSYYGRSHILHGVTLNIPAGKVTSILGRNGTGKTTLLKTLMALTDRMTGEMHLQGKDIGSSSTHMRARAGIAYVPRAGRSFPISPSARTS